MQIGSKRDAPGSWQIMAEAISMEDIKSAMSTQKLKPLNRTVIFPHRVGSILPTVVDDKLVEVRRPNDLPRHL